METGGFDSHEEESKFIDGTEGEHVTEDRRLVGAQASDEETECGEEQE